MSDTTFIYVLKDPRDNRVRYVGKTVNVKNRWYDHIELNSTKNSNNRRKYLWLKEIKLLNLNPIMEVIEECSEEIWQERERYWIKHYRFMFDDLLNVTDGGECGPRLFGDLNPNSALSWDDVREVRYDYNSGKIDIKDITIKYGITAKSVHDLLSNKCYTDVNYERTRYDIFQQPQLNRKQADDIRKAYSNGVSIVEICKMFHRSPNVICRVLRNEVCSDENYSIKISPVGKIGKVSNDDVIEIRKRYIDGEKIIKICEDYNITSDYCGRICRNDVYFDSNYQKPSERITTHRCKFSKDKKIEIKEKHTLGIRRRDLYKEYGIENKYLIDGAIDKSV